MPTFSSQALDYTAADALLEGMLANHDGDIPLPSLLIVYVPGDLDRARDNLDLSLNGTRYGLTDAEGQPVIAAQLTPGGVCLMGRFVNQYRILTALPRRPQDYDFRMAFSPDLDLSAAEIAAGATFPTNQVVIPDFGADPAYWFIGVPDDTGDITSWSQQGGFDNFGVYVRVPGTIDDPDGVPYKWWSSRFPVPAPASPGATGCSARNTRRIAP